jgi:hypothetical protein
MSTRRTGHIVFICADEVLHGKGSPAIRNSEKRQRCSCISFELKIARGVRFLLPFADEGHLLHLISKSRVHNSRCIASYERGRENTKCLVLDVRIYSKTHHKCVRKCCRGVECWPLGRIRTAEMALSHSMSKLNSVTCRHLAIFTLIPHSQSSQAFQTQCIADGKNNIMTSQRLRERTRVDLSIGVRLKIRVHIRTFYF